MIPLQMELAVEVGVLEQGEMTLEKPSESVRCEARIGLDLTTQEVGMLEERIMQPKITIEIWQKGRWFISKYPELDFISQGTSPEEAKRNLLEVIQIQFEEMTVLGALDDYMSECGFVREKYFELLNQVCA